MALICIRVYGPPSLYAPARQCVMGAYPDALPQFTPGAETSGAPHKSTEPGWLDFWFSSSKPEARKIPTDRLDVRGRVALAYSVIGEDGEHYRAGARFNGLWVHHSARGGSVREAVRFAGGRVRAARLIADGETSLMPRLSKVAAMEHESSSLQGRDEVLPSSIAELLQLEFEDPVDLGTALWGRPPPHEAMDESLAQGDLPSLSYHTLAIAESMSP